MNEMNEKEMSIEGCKVKVEDDMTKVSCDTRGKANKFHKAFEDFVKKNFTIEPHTHKGKETTAIMVGKNWPDKELFTGLKHFIERQDNNKMVPGVGLWQKRLMEVK